MQKDLNSKIKFTNKNIKFKDKLNLKKAKQKPPKLRSKDETR